MRIIMLLADTQAWLNELGNQVIQQVQPAAKKLFGSKGYRLSIHAFAHIIERHYYKTLRYPGTGKFDIPLSAILQLIKDAAVMDATPMKGSQYFKRILPVNSIIGITKNGEPSSAMTVITDEQGNIITAYPE